MVSSQLEVGSETNCNKHKNCISPGNNNIRTNNNDTSIEEKNKRLERAQWVRAAILGANDGLLSTTAIMVGMGAAKEDGRDMILSGLAGALAGACSMAVGEFVSVATQRDIEKSIVANSSKQNAPLVSESEVNDMEMFGKNTSSVLKKEEELETIVLPNPYKAAVASGLAFLSGSFVPLASALLVPYQVVRVVVIVVVTSVALVLFGFFGARLGGSPVRVSAARVLVGGWIAMGITYGLLKPFSLGSD